MTVYIYGYDDKGDMPMVIATCAKEVQGLGHRIVWKLSEADVAVAPLLQVRITDAELSQPKYGVLVFHPSLLPRHRGRDAIKWAYNLNETYTGATWFWANNEIDGGDICEQAVIAIGDKKPREFYETVVIPVAVQLLHYALLDLASGIIRRRPQNESAATYEPPFPKK